MARRASGNEFFVAGSPRRKGRLRARCLIATLNKNKITQAPWKQEEISALTWSVSRFDTHIAAQGPGS